MNAELVFEGRNYSYDSSSDMNDRCAKACKCSTGARLLFLLCTLLLRVQQIEEK